MEYSKSNLKNVYLDEIDGLIPKEDNVSSPRLFQQMNTPDLGKYLIDAAKNGDVDQVRRLISNNANFTTDWVRVLY